MGDLVPQGTSGNAYRLGGCHRMLQASRWWEILLDTSFSTQDIVRHGVKPARISLEPRMRTSAEEIRFKSFRSQVWASLGENHSREGTDLSSQQEYARKWFIVYTFESLLCLSLRLVYQVLISGARCLPVLVI